MKKSQLIKIIKEEIQATVSEGRYDYAIRKEQSKDPFLSELATIGNLTGPGVSDKDFETYHSHVVQDPAKQTVTHYFKEKTPTEVINKAANFVKLSAENTTRAINFLKKHNKTVEATAYTASTPIGSKLYGGSVKVVAKAIDAPAQGDQRPVAPAASKKPGER